MRIDDNDDDRLLAYTLFIATHSSNAQRCWQRRQQTRERWRNEFNKLLSVHWCIVQEWQIADKITTYCWLRINICIGLLQYAWNNVTLLVPHSPHQRRPAIFLLNWFVENLKKKHNAIHRLHWHDLRTAGQVLRSRYCTSQLLAFKEEKIICNFIFYIFNGIPL